ncbi:MAG: hypothetical protein IKL22_00570 [Lachnospiraceae bacterium]|nr:hypothetical protein [Lachnospiraceae bacterium]
MANELISLNVTKKDIDRVNRILDHTKEPFPIEKAEKESPRLRVTREFLEGLEARKKRWESRDVRIEIKYEDITKKQDETDPYPDQLCLKEGIYEIGRLRKEWKQTITYKRQNKKYINSQNKRRINYYLLKEAGEEDKISSVFMEDNDGHQLQYFGREEELEDGEGKESRRAGFLAIFWGCILWILFAIVFLTCRWGGICAFLMVMLYLKFPILLMISFFYSPWFIAQTTPLRKQRLRSRKITRRILERSPDFCLEKLIGIFNSRLLRLIYADRTEDIRDFVSCDATAFLKDHADVITCEFINFAFTGLREEDGCMYLDVKYTIFLERDLEESVGRSEETILLQLVRPVDGIMESDLYNDWSIINIETNKK